jgi:hypothetical protein
MIDDDIKQLIQILMKAGMTWEKDVVIQMYIELVRLREQLK